jgi:hypothetical protein
MFMSNRIVLAIGQIVITNALFAASSGVALTPVGNLALPVVPPSMPRWAGGRALTLENNQSKEPILHFYERDGREVCGFRGMSISVPN